MSYIRCTGNPDKAYVWYDMDGAVHFTVSGNKGKQAKFNASIEDPFCVPHRTFVGLIKNIMDGKLTTNSGYYSYGGFSVMRSIKTGRTTLSYLGRYIKMWEVTWMFIVHKAEEELAQNRRKRT